MVDAAASAPRKPRWPYGDLIGEGSIAEVNEPGEAPPLLALHGFGATPNEVLMLTDLAREFGLRRRAPMLPGHGTHARDLAKTSYPQWYARGEQELIALTADGPAIVGGQSMGSVVAMDLAERHPHRVAALLLFANATRMASPYPNLALAAAERLGVPDFQMPKFNGPNILDLENRGSHVTYSSQPMKAAFSLRRAGMRVLKGLPKVHCPTFIAHGVLDGTCPVSNAWEVAERLGTTDVEMLLLPDSAHIVTKDRDRERLRQGARAFLSRVLAELRHQPPVEP